MTASYSYRHWGNKRRGKDWCDVISKYLSKNNQGIHYPHNKTTAKRICISKQIYRTKKKDGRGTLCQCKGNQKS